MCLFPLFHSETLLLVAGSRPLVGIHYHAKYSLSIAYALALILQIIPLSSTSNSFPMLCPKYRYLSQLHLITPHNTFRSLSYKQREFLFSDVWIHSCGHVKFFWLNVFMIMNQLTRLTTVHVMDSCTPELHQPHLLHFLSSWE